jgi:hypothetical protein
LTGGCVGFANADPQNATATTAAVSFNAVFMKQLCALARLKTT